MIDQILTIGFECNTSMMLHFIYPNIITIIFFNNKMLLSILGLGWGFLKFDPRNAQAKERGDGGNKLLVVYLQVISKPSQKSNNLDDAHYSRATSLRWTVISLFSDAQTLICLGFVVFSHLRFTQILQEEGLIIQYLSRFPQTNHQLMEVGGIDSGGRNMRGRHDHWTGHTHQRVVASCHNGREFLNYQILQHMLILQHVT